MPGRTPPPKQDLLSMLLGKLGMAPAKKSRKGKRRKNGSRPRPRPEDGYAEPSGYDAMSAYARHDDENAYARHGDENAYAQHHDEAAYASDAAAHAYAPSDYAQAQAAASASPFGDYEATSGLGFEPADHSYAAAAAAGYAPPPAPPLAPIVPLFPDGVPPSGAATPSLPFHSEPPAPAAPASLPSTDGRLFSEEALDSSLDALFSGLEMGQAPLPTPAAEPAFAPPPPLPAAASAPAPAAPLPPAPAPASASSASGPAPGPIMPPSLPNVAPAPPASAKAPTGPLGRAPNGSLATGGAYQASGSPLPAAEVLTLSQGTDLRALLATIDRAPGVAGSLLVGHDGLIIATTLPPDIDGELMGAQACNMFTGNSGQTVKMQRGELKRVVLETANGVMLMTAADMGILVIVSQNDQAMDVGGVLAALNGALGRA